LPHKLYHQMKKIQCFLIAVILTATVSFAQDKKPEIYDHEKIFAPTVVANLTQDAFYGLCWTKDCKIRHYGGIMKPDKTNKAVYLESADNGLSWTMHEMQKGDRGSMWLKSPYSKYWTGFYFSIPMRSKTGPGDTDPELLTPLPFKDNCVTSLIAMKSRKRFVAAVATDQIGPKDGYQAEAAYSDDDGKTWTTAHLKQADFVPRMCPGDARARWYCNGAEPTVAELSDGTLLIAARTSGPWHTFYKSDDGGETWSAPYYDKNFWACNTTPNLLTLKDGRLMFIWNNTAPLPTRPAEEFPELTNKELQGVWESYFTNRDVLHAAISDDDGKTWHGFREIALNDVRNDADYREQGGAPRNGHDRSVHMTSALELPDGKVLLAYGQERVSARICIFDPEWLYETSAREDFSSGFANLSNFLYVRSLAGGRKGWGGHCNMNRVPGALLVRDPDTKRGTKAEVLQLCRIRDPRLLSDRQGVVWNFPAARKGVLTTECRIDGEGFQLALCDHWMNPCDEFGPKQSPVVFRLTRKELPQSDWYKVSVEWDFEAAKAALIVNGETISTVSINDLPPSGLSYLHLQTLAEEYDPYGTYFRYFQKD